MTHELLNHKTKCRLCFKRMSGTRNISRITGSVQKKFFSLTNIELKSSDKFSNSICKPCMKSLNETSEFQTKMIDNQRRLYAFEGEADAPVKAEPIESETIKLQEISIEDVFPFKTEVFDNTWPEKLETQTATPSEVACRQKTHIDFKFAQKHANLETATSDEKSVLTVNHVRKRRQHEYSLKQLSTTMDAASTGELFLNATEQQISVPKSTVRNRFRKKFRLLFGDKKQQLKSPTNKSSDFGISCSDVEIAIEAFRVPKNREVDDRFRKLPCTGSPDRQLPVTFPETETGDVYTCDDCGYFFEEKGDLEVHVSIHRKLKQSVRSCKDAVMKSSNKTDGFTTNGTGFDVAQCTTTVPKALPDNPQKNQRNNIRTTNPRWEQQIFKCSFCEKFFFLDSSRRTHEEMCTAFRTILYSCKDCRTVFSSKQDLTDHSCASLVALKSAESPQAFPTQSRLVHQKTRKAKVIIKARNGMPSHPILRRPTLFKCTVRGCLEVYDKLEPLRYHLANSHDARKCAADRSRNFTTVQKKLQEHRWKLENKIFRLT